MITPNTYRKLVLLINVMAFKALSRQYFYRGNDDLDLAHITTEQLKMVSACSVRNAIQVVAIISPLRVCLRIPRLCPMCFSR